MPQVNPEAQKQEARWKKKLDFWNGRFSPLDKPLFTGVNLSVYLLLTSTQFMISVY